MDVRILSSIMKKILYILLLFSCAATAQPRFFRQSDNTVHFGANLQGLSTADEIIFVRDSLRFSYIRHSVTLSAYTTGINTGLQQMYNAGLHVILNINWGAGTQPRDFPTGATLTTFASKLTTFLSFNKQFLTDGIIVIENEPYNALFYNYNDHDPFMAVTDYINELDVAIPIIQALDLKVADGATHLNYYEDLVTLPVTNANAKRADTAFGYYAAMNLNWVNYHFAAVSNMGTNSSMTADLIRDYTTYGTGRTGHNYISNEWHQEADGTSSDWDSFAISIVNRTRQAHIRVALIFGGDGSSDGLELVDNILMKLTQLGITYRDAVIP